MLKAEQLSLGFSGAEAIVSGADLTVSAGTPLLICGATGSGKTTLLHALSGVIPRLLPNPGYAGRVTLLDKPLSDYSRDALFADLGLVTQAVEDQLWDLSTEDIIAFPMENRALPKAQIRARLRLLMEQLELTELAGRRVLTLSGGERRMVAIAAALAARPKVLILDEPTTGLDPAARKRLSRALDRAGAEVGAIVIAEQDPTSLVDTIHDIALLQDGCLTAPEPKARLLADPERWRKAGLIAPARAPASHPTRATSSPTLSLKGLTSRLTRASGQPVLNDLSLDLFAGEVVALLGRNGAGKTTLFRSVLGLLPIRGGKIVLGGEPAEGWTTAKRARKIAYLPQNMRQILFNMTVLEEVLFAITAKPGAAAPEQKARACEILARYGLGGQEQTNPFALSARQQGQLGLACAEAAAAPLTIIDEPLLARDLRGRALFERFLENATSSARTVLLITHDLELAQDVADRSLLMEDGAIAYDGPVRDCWDSAAFRALGWPAPYRSPAQNCPEGMPR